MGQIRKMAVHSGVFHADDVFAVALMTTVIEDLQVIRTREESILSECEIVADVGEGKYDHHQKDKKLREDGIPYCAFGLLWQDYGQAYVQKQFPMLSDKVQQQKVVDKVANEFITQIDASDNGVDINTYEIPVTTISQVISSFMPFRGKEEEVDKGFKEAVAFAKTFLYKVVRKYVESYYNYHYVQKQLEMQQVQTNHFLVLEEHVGWKEALLMIDTKKEVLFVVFQDIVGSWRVQTVPKELKSFEARVNLPASWGGLRDEMLEKETGIKGCIFCHPGLFICGNETKEGAIAMAYQAVQYYTDISTSV